MMKFKLNPFTSLFIMLLIISMTMFLASLYLINNKEMFLISYLFTYMHTPIINVNILLDSSNTLFSSTVTFISSNIMLFSMSYMAQEKFPLRFSYLIFMFILSMNLLIFIPNFITLLIGWDGLGIVSFILVIYYQNNKSLGAGMITLMTNRLGDVLILLSIVILSSQSHWTIIFMWEESLIKPTLLMILMTLAFSTKSAQIPFSAWLPAAMAAPTPVSALVHSSTLVTAGVFLLLRFHPFLSKIKNFNELLLIMGVSTMLMAGMAATLENDMKKIIALSTLSQLGVMVTSIAMNLVSLAFFHLISHALFKALLFICCGMLINFHLHSQDLRSMGSIINKLPMTSTATMIANLALCGFPFTAGFYSKDMIIESAFMTNTNLFVSLLFSIATMLTAIYSLRFMMILFSINQHSAPPSMINDNMKAPTLAMVLMSTTTITGGALFSWSFNSLMQEPLLPMFMKTSTMMIIMLGSMLALYLSTPKLFKLSPLMSTPHFFLTTMWSLAMSTPLLSLPSTYKLSWEQYKNLDQGWFETMGPKGVMKTLNFTTKLKSIPQNLTINSSILLILTSMTMLTTMT